MVPSFKVMHFKLNLSIMLLTVISLETEHSFFHMLTTETATFREKAQDRDVYENCHTKTFFFSDAKIRSSSVTIQVCYHANGSLES